MLLEFGYMKSNKIPSCTGSHGLNQMLDQVKDHLEYFEMESNMYELEDSPSDVDARIGFQFPQMKNLEEFRNNMLDCFSCGDHLQDICTARMPALEILHITKRDNTVDDLLRNIITKQDLFSGVKNLRLENVRNPESITGLKTAFPNLETLSIYQFNADESSLLMEVGPHLQVCAPLGLKYLNLYLSNRHEKLSEFVQGFLICGELLPSLKTLEIESFSGVSDDLDLVVDGEAQMKQCLLELKGLENVMITGIEFKEETWKWVESFIYENKIPIVFDKTCYPSMAKDQFILHAKKYRNAEIISVV
ncbi:uncharacterized protein LOC110849687 isoform X1 [Folsomia candida]|nr:uncharacterized protein LOC110849687 isoform X1 [Folsomia candida]XP_035707811.1 uncharacterized protein LOC110849687 isoform X1 [Folsomia candida]XP_035707812.1 uncharacterized protein LOC110849687 isoform X1 [Folsomia candida]XP_035707813.1 uncharacterized protein LOC110849687 isoform X1 [Folsomia candida]XP_035707814.1 uncharacterized protein LOC110849687 isoform X1 [Folsomia candida]